MKKTNLPITTICALGLLAGSTALADQVLNVNFGSAAGADVAPSRSLDVDTGTTKTYNFSDTNLMFEGSVGAGQSFFAGMHHLGQGGNSINQYRIQNIGTPTLHYAMANGTTSGLETLKFINIWDDATNDFSGNNTFGATSDSSFSISMSQWIQENSGATGGLQFVLRDSGTYYIANQVFGESNGGFDAEIFGDTIGLEWASFDPTQFTDYDASNANLGNISLSAFSAQTFSNVEAVGFIGENLRFAGNNARMDDFQVSLVPEPSTYALLSGLIALAGVMIRRRRA